jgi:hypothetical protein
MQLVLVGREHRIEVLGIEIEEVDVVSDIRENGDDLVS